MKFAVHGCVSAQGVVPYAQRQMEAWDLHVGARLNLLGKQVGAPMGVLDAACVGARGQAWGRMVET